MAGVLLIDSDEDFVLLLQAQLDVHGLDIRIATDSTEGLKMARQERPDMVVIQAEMPNTSGTQFANLVYGDDELKGVPVALIKDAAAQVDDDEQADILPKSVCGVLSKPCSEAAVLRLLSANISDFDPDIPDEPDVVIEEDDEPDEAFNLRLGIFSSDRETYEPLSEDPKYDIKITPSAIHLLAGIRHGSFDLILIDCSWQTEKACEMVKRMQEDNILKDCPVALVSADKLDAECAEHLEPLAKFSLTHGFSLESLDDAVMQHFTFADRLDTQQALEDDIVDEDEFIEGPDPLDDAAITEMIDTDPSDYIREIMRDVDTAKFENLARDIAIYCESTDDEAKWDSRSRLSTMFWLLYQTILKDFSEMRASFAKKMLIRFGILEKRLLLDRYQKVFFSHCEQFDRSQTIPIYYLDEWLGLIRSSKVKISSTKLNASADEGGSRELDKAVAKELHINRIMMKMIMGRYGNPFPVLENSRIKDIDRCVNFREVVAKVMNDVNEDLDPTLFIRSFSKRHIFPYVIILPFSGSRGMCWDPWDPQDKKNSRGKLILPLATLRDSKEIIIKALADYRWDCGANQTRRYWESDSVVSAYYQLYRKKTKFDVKKQFIEDYYIWLTKEAYGRSILDKETRKVLWQYVPFSERIRTKLLQSNTYRQLLSRKEMRQQSH